MRRWRQNKPRIIPKVTKNVHDNRARRADFTEKPLAYRGDAPFRALSVRYGAEIARFKRALSQVRETI